MLVLAIWTNTSTCGKGNRFSREIVNMFL
jgi:hypothetical protein